MCVSDMKIQPFLLIYDHSAESIWVLNMYLKFIKDFKEKFYNSIQQFIGIIQTRL